MQRKGNVSRCNVPNSISYNGEFTNLTLYCLAWIIFGSSEERFHVEKILSKHTCINEKILELSVWYMYRQRARLFNKIDKITCLQAL